MAVMSLIPTAKIQQLFHMAKYYLAMCMKMRNFAVAKKQ